MFSFEMSFVLAQSYAYTCTYPYACAYVDSGVAHFAASFCLTFCLDLCACLCPVNIRLCAFNLNLNNCLLAWYLYNLI